MPAPFPLRGRTVLITGAGSGIGRRLALGASRVGARIVVWDLDEAAAERTRVAVEREGGEARASRVDVSDREAVEAAAAALEHDGWGPDVLVNNAGVVSGRPFLDTTPEQIERTFRVNTLALFWTTRAFLPGMLARGRGRIVTVASAAGLIGVARLADYAASKHAAVGFTESLRQELRADGSPVSTLVVEPFYIDTGMFDGVTTRIPGLLPILKAPYAAGRILRAIERGDARLRMPALVSVLPLVDALPVTIGDRVADLFGVHRGMSGFAGRGLRADGTTASAPTPATHHRNGA